MNADWVMIKSCRNLVDAQILVAVLDANGVDAMIPDEQFFGMRPEMATGQGGVRVLVKKSQLDAANELTNDS